MGEISQNQYFALKSQSSKMCPTTTAKQLCKLFKILLFNIEE